MSKYGRLPRALLICVAGLSVAGTAHAGSIVVNSGTGHITRQEIVSSADLNLTTPAGYGRMMKRINTAVRHVCDIAGGSALNNTRDARGCVATSRADALGQLSHLAYAQNDGSMATGTH